MARKGTKANARSQENRRTPTRPAEQPVAEPAPTGVAPKDAPAANQPDEESLQALLRHFSISG